MTSTASLLYVLLKSVKVLTVMIVYGTYVFFVDAFVSSFDVSVDVDVDVDVAVFFSFFDLHYFQNGISP